VWDGEGDGANSGKLKLEAPRKGDIDPAGQRQEA